MSAEYEQKLLPLLTSLFGGSTATPTGDVIPFPFLPPPLLELIVSHLSLQTHTFDRGFTSPAVQFTPTRIVADTTQPGITTEYPTMRYGVLSSSVSGMYRASVSFCVNGGFDRRTGRNRSRSQWTCGLVSIQRRPDNPSQLVGLDWVCYFNHRQFVSVRLYDDDGPAMSTRRSPVGYNGRAATVWITVDVDAARRAVSFDVGCNSLGVVFANIPLRGGDTAFKELRVCLMLTEPDSSAEIVPDPRPNKES